MKRGLKGLSSLVIGIFFLSLVSASFRVGNVSIETSYGPGENLRGWINISLQDESTNSLLTAFNSNITILDFLKNTSAIYSCFPVDCETGYTVTGKETSKTFSLDFGKKQTIGLKIEGKIESIDDFFMKITSTASESSYPQLFVDILNNNEIEWQAYKPSGNFLSENYGCYNSSDVTGEAEITQIEYCEKITLSLCPNVKIGANISAVAGKGGNVDFEMHIYDDDYDASCIASASGSGKISCIVDVKIKKKQDFFVCIRTKDSANNRKYSINYEQNSPCGFSGEPGEYNYDFAIFAQAGKYKAIGSFVLNNAELEKASSSINDLASYIEDYVSDRYENDCTDGCVIPINFISGKQQDITVSDVSLSYTSGISKTTHDIYDSEKETAKINMNFQKLNLEKANFEVPSSYGTTTLILELGDEEIISKKIEVMKIPIIDYVAPLNLPSSIPVKFIVFVSGNVRSYKWDFGDGTVEETIENTTHHTYKATGNYNLKITVKNGFGEISKTFSVEVRSPKDEINRTLADKKQQLAKTKQDLEAITSWYKEELEKLVGIGDIETELKSLEQEYKSATASGEYVEIMSNLLKLEIPTALKSEKSSGDFLPHTEQINLDYLTEITGTKIEEQEKYKDSIINWINENIDIKVESESYYLKYPEKETAILTAVKLKIKPKKDVGESYLIIDKNYGEITFKENYNEKAISSATVITFSVLEKEKEEIIEFIFPEKIEIMELPIFISPKFSQLPENGEIAPCNHNEKCEKELGETAENCPSDCRNWKKIIVYLAILLFIAFVIYIILQEWYKRYYESHLFKDKNDLFNLINFINNALHQELSKDDIFKKLKPYGWKNEQINYALKKVYGKRTGMWEIPVFRWFEKRKIREEIEKRQKLGIVSIQYPPRYQ